MTCDLTLNPAIQEEFSVLAELGKQIDRLGEGSSESLRNFEPSKALIESPTGLGVNSMATSRMKAGVSDIQTHFQVGSAVGLSDAQLLERYMSGCEKNAEIATREHDRRFRASVTGEPWAELFEEIDRLSERHRSAIVPCDLESLTHEQAARRLGCPVKTVQGRLYRARELLRHRLTRRGVTTTAAMLSVTLAHRTASAAPSAPWVEGTALAAAQLAAGQGGERFLSAQSAELFRSVLRAMTMTTLKIAALGGFVLATTAMGMAMVWGTTGKTGVVDPPTQNHSPPVAAAESGGRARAAEKPEAQAGRVDLCPGQVAHRARAKHPGKKLQRCRELGIGSDSTME